jgi:hypothetical protein
MATDNLTSTRKALQINLDDSIYGAFAEIGAGQEVARHFFTAGRASHTIAKTMSAYDMTVSDAIYGKTTRYVCEDRLIKMLDHEYERLTSRLKEKRGNDTRFFAFADTVATSSHNETSRCHGWMGIRFQTRPGGPPNEIILHVSMLDPMRLDQQNALGVLGVNLIFSAFNHLKNPSLFVSELNDNLGSTRAEIDLLVFRGPDLSHIENRDLALELVSQGLSKAILFGPDGKVVQAADALFRKPLVVQRGTFRPVTRVNQEILEKGMEQLHLIGDLGGQEPLPLMEMTLKEIGQQDQSERKDMLERVETLTSIKAAVLISRYSLFYELKQFLRQCTQNTIGFVIGASHLEKIMNPDFYSLLPGGLLEAMGHLFDDKTGFLVYPFKNMSRCMTAKTFHPDPKNHHLYSQLLENGRIIDMVDCDSIDVSIQSSDVRDLLKKSGSEWEKLVPPSVADLIRRKNLFQN